MNDAVLVTVRCWCGRLAAEIHKSDDGPRLGAVGLNQGPLKEATGQSPLLDQLNPIVSIACPLTGTSDEHRPGRFFLARDELLEIWQEARASGRIPLIAEKPSVRDFVTGNPEGPYIRRA